MESTPTIFPKINIANSLIQNKDSIKIKKKTNNEEIFLSILDHIPPHFPSSSTTSSFSSSSSSSSSSSFFLNQKKKPNEITTKRKDFLFVLNKPLNLDPVNNFYTSAICYSKLYPHQRAAVLYMLWSHFLTYTLNYGGKFLLDDTGLGKTLTMVCFFLHLREFHFKYKKNTKLWTSPIFTKQDKMQKLPKTEEEIKNLENKITNLTKNGFPFSLRLIRKNLRILIVIPNGLIESTWENDCEQIYGPGFTSHTYKWTGENRKLQRSRSVFEHSYWVYTTYDVLAAEYKKKQKQKKSKKKIISKSSTTFGFKHEEREEQEVQAHPIFDTHWDILFLEEGATIRNSHKKGHNLLRGNAIKEIKFGKFYLATATPICNSYWDLCSYLEIMRHPSATDLQIFESEDTEKQKEFLQSFREQYVIRRTCEDKYLWPTRKPIIFISCPAEKLQAQCLRFLLDCYAKHQKNIKNECKGKFGIPLSFAKFESIAANVGTTGIRRFRYKIEKELKKLETQKHSSIYKYWENIKEEIDISFPLKEHPSDQNGGNNSFSSSSSTFLYDEIIPSSAIKFQKILSTISNICKNSEDRIVIFFEFVVIAIDFMKYVAQECKTIPYIHLNYNYQNGAPCLSLIKGTETGGAVDHRLQLIKKFNNQSNRLAWYIREQLVNDQWNTHSLFIDIRPDKLSELWCQMREEKHFYTKKFLTKTLVILEKKNVQKRESLLMISSENYCPMQSLRILEMFLLDEKIFTSQQVEERFQYLFTILDQIFSFKFHFVLQIDDEKERYYNQSTSSSSSFFHYYKWVNEEQIWKIYDINLYSNGILIETFIHNIYCLLDYRKRVEKYRTKNTINQTFHLYNFLLNRFQIEYFNRIEFSTLPFIIIWHLLKLMKKKYQYNQQENFFTHNNNNNNNNNNNPFPWIQKKEEELKYFIFTIQNENNFFLQDSSSSSNHFSLTTDKKNLFLFQCKQMYKEKYELNVLPFLIEQNTFYQNYLEPIFYFIYNDSSLQDKFNLLTLQDRIVLVSEKFGGFGLNLLSASHVIIIGAKKTSYEFLQAIGRIQRIKQLSSVRVYRFILTYKEEDKKNLGILSIDEYNLIKYELKKLHTQLIAFPQKNNQKIVEDYKGPIEFKEEHLIQYNQLRGGITVEENENEKKIKISHKTKNKIDKFKIQKQQKKHKKSSSLFVSTPSTTSTSSSSSCTQFKKQNSCAKKRKRLVKVNNEAKKSEAEKDSNIKQKQNKNKKAKKAKTILSSHSTIFPCLPMNNLVAKTFYLNEL